MKLTRALLEQAAQRGVIAHEQVDALWAFLAQHSADTPSFRVTHILYYLGGLIAIGAMTLFMTLGWEQFGGWGLFFIAFAYAAAGLWLDLLPEGVAVKETVGELRRGSRRSVARRDWKRGRSLAVRLLRVEGMGHAWSGGAAGQAFSDPSGPDALRLAWQFFETVMEQAAQPPV